MAVEAVRRGVNDDLNVSEVLDLLNSDIQVVINTTENGSKIVNACGGEVYVCHRKPDDWRFDGFRWRQIGKSQMPKKAPVVIKYHYHLTTPDGLCKQFRKFVYTHIREESSAKVVIHYIGDSNLATNFPHGNADRSVNFLPTPTTLKEDLADKNVKLADLCASKSKEPVQFQPRNSQQKTYFENRAKSKISKDSFCNVHELAYALPDFIWSITTHPDLFITFGLPEFVNLVRMCKPAFLTYDTTFKLGDFYVTSFVVQLGMFVEKPVVPVAFMLHERKFQRLHEEFCFHFSKKLGTAPKDVVVATDGEQGCSNALQAKFPHWHVLTCWNHLLRDAEFWLKKQNAQHSEIVIYKSQLHDLLNCDTLSSVKMKESTYKALWSVPFVNYYDQCLGDRVVSSFKGVMDECGLVGDSVTTNNSESMNAVIKRFQGWKEVPADRLLLSMYKLQLAYGARINKSKQGFGPFVLLDSAFELLNLPEFVTEDDFDDILPPAKSDEVIPNVIVDTAKLLKVLHIPEQQVFNVATASGTVHVVHLFPSEKCTCPSGTTCCHILAARNSIGKQSLERKTINLSKLRRRARKKNDKTSGRKQPRKADVTFTVAPDSSFAEGNNTMPSPVNASCNITDRESSPAQSNKAEDTALDPRSTGSTSTPVSKTRKRRLSTVCMDSSVSNMQDSSTPKSAAKKRVRFACEIPESELASHQLSVDPCINQSDGATAIINDEAAVLEPDVDVCNKTETTAAASDCADDEQNDKPLIGPAEREILLGTHSITRKAWLNDVIINAAQSLLRAKFPSDMGLRDTIVVNAGHVHLDDPSMPFVQVFFDQASEHWITVTNRCCRPNTVRVYCSLLHRPSAKCRLVISQYVRCNSSRLTFQVMNVAKQRNVKDCGLYAIAFAEQLLSGNDPSPSVFKQDAMRQHLLDCLLKKNLSAFPISNFRTFRKSVEAEFTEELYCYCKGISEGVMIQCDRCDVWFHAACLKLPQPLVEVYQTKKSLQFKCDICLIASQQSNCTKDGKAGSDKGNGYWENVASEGPVICSITQTSVNVEELFDDDNVKQLKNNCVLEIGEDEYYAKLDKEISEINCLKDLQNRHLEYLVKRNERYILELLQGKVLCERHIMYRQGGQDRRFLNWLLPVGAFNYDQFEVIMSAITDLLGTLQQKYFDYAIRVLMPEVMIKITMDLKTMDHDDAEKYLFACWQ